MEVRQKFKLDAFGQETLVAEQIVPDPRPTYPTRHVVDGVLLVTLTAADYDAMVGNMERLMLHANGAVEAFDVLVAQQQAVAEAEQQLGLAPVEPVAPDETERARLATIADRIVTAPVAGSVEPAEPSAVEFTASPLPRPTHKPERGNRRRRKSSLDWPLRS